MARLLSVRSREDSAFLRRQLFKEYTISYVLERRLIFGRFPFRIIRVVLTVGRSLPVHPDQRTFAEYVGTSQSGPGAVVLVKD